MDIGFQGHGKDRGSKRSLAGILDARMLVFLTGYFLIYENPAFTGQAIIERSGWAFRLG